MKEDFVTYDLAVKLKEKGFCERVRAHYKSERHLSVCSEPMNCNGSVSGDISAPQIHEVLKWLREEKGMEVYSNYNRVYKHWTYIARAFDDSCYNSVGGFKSYEQAALAGIEYVIDNLI